MDGWCSDGILDYFKSILIRWLPNSDKIHTILRSEKSESRKIGVFCGKLLDVHWRRSALNSAGALVQGGDGEFRGFFTPYHKFSGIV